MGFQVRGCLETKSLKTTFYAVSMVRLKTELLEDRSPIMLLGISNSLIC